MSLPLTRLLRITVHIFFHSEGHHTAEVKWLVNPFSCWLNSKMCNTSLWSSIKQQSSNILFKICLFVERLQHYLTSKRMIQVNINVKGVLLRKGLWTWWTGELIFTTLWKVFLWFSKVSLFQLTVRCFDWSDWFRLCNALSLAAFGRGFCRIWFFLKEVLSGLSFALVQYSDGRLLFLFIPEDLDDPLRVWKRERRAVKHEARLIR